MKKCDFPHFRPAWNVWDQWQSTISQQCYPYLLVYHTLCWMARAGLRDAALLRERRTHLEGNVCLYNQPSESTSVCVSVIINKILTRQVTTTWVCNWSTKKRTRDVCVFVHARSRKGMGVCLCVCACYFHSPVDSYFFLTFRQLLVCACIYVKTAKRLRRHNTFILLLIMNYFILKIVSYSYTSTQ